MATALISGISGQDGSYLTEQLLSRGYDVKGLIVGHEDLKNLSGIVGHERLELISGELIDQAFLFELIGGLTPDFIYNLAGQSFVPMSWRQPVFTGDFNGLSVTRLLEAIRITSPKTKIYQASSSEMFGSTRAELLDESSLLAPCSPYAAAKAYGHHIIGTYRDSYGLFACSGMLFNHESPRRGSEFVTQKIARGVSAIANGDGGTIRLGNPGSIRDWGYAADYTRAMTLMLEHSIPDDYVVATGEAHSVREFCDAAFQYVGIKDWDAHVEFLCPEFLRPKDVGYLRGNAGKARRVLGWEPVVRFEQLVGMMVESALKVPK